MRRDEIFYFLFIFILFFLLRDRRAMHVECVSYEYDTKKQNAIAKFYFVYDIYLYDTSCVRGRKNDYYYEIIFHIATE